MFGYLGAVAAGSKGAGLPKPGSTVTGPIPPEYIGTEKTATGAGPKQLKCVAQHGHWIGPEGLRWCQLVPGEAVPALAVAAPSPVAAAPSPVSTASIPPGAELASVLQTMTSPATPEMTMAPGLQTGVTGAPGVTPVGMNVPFNQLTLPSTGSPYLVPGLAIGAVALLGYFFMRKRGGAGAARAPRRASRGYARVVRRSYKRRARRVSRRYKRASARRR